MTRWPHVNAAQVDRVLDREAGIEEELLAREHVEGCRECFDRFASLFDAAALAALPRRPVRKILHWSGLAAAAAFLLLAAVGLFVAPAPPAMTGSAGSAHSLRVHSLVYASTRESPEETLRETWIRRAGTVIEHGRSRTRHSEDGSFSVSSNRTTFLSTKGG